MRGDFYNQAAKALGEKNNKMKKNNAGKSVIQTVAKFLLLNFSLHHYTVVQRLALLPHSMKSHWGLSV